MLFEIDGKVAVITGGATGIGLKFAHELLKNGLKGITIADFDATKGNAAAHDLNNEFGKDKVIFVKTDVTDMKQFEDAFKKTLKHFKHVDILINNAGIMNDAIWEKEIQVNINGVIHGMLLGFDNYLKNYRSGNEGVILNLSSIAGIKGYGYMPVYCATKFSVMGMVKSWSSPTHYERTKVRVIGLCPGATDTALMDMTGKFIGPGYEETLKDITGDHSLQSPDVVAREMVKIMKHSKNGAIWVVEGGEPGYEFILPEREIFKKKM